MNLINTVFRKHRNLYFNLCLATAFSFLLLLFRIKITHSYFYTFLVWNLFLAAIPFFITQVMKYYSTWKNSKPQKILLFVTWLLFLPNSPYIITDLIHLHDHNSILKWLDLFLVFVFALNGLLLGLLSLLDMYVYIKNESSKTKAHISIFLISVLSGYGIYLGRFLRFNSWDFLTQPLYLFEQIRISLTEPKVWAITIAFGGLLWILFLLMQSALRINTKHNTTESK
ncbi:DUF1361 domain-containing protein [Aurantibacter sp.]|uniref:DUF1361 domain-containing protein n=1 Tax=Aurantibacter sp. TaxID=2807103 RepID=UPI003263477C